MVAGTMRMGGNIRAGQSTLQNKLRVRLAGMAAASPATPPVLRSLPELRPSDIPTLSEHAQKSG